MTGPAGGECGPCAWHGAGSPHVSGGEKHSEQTVFHHGRCQPPSARYAHQAEGGRLLSQPCPTEKLRKSIVPIITSYNHTCPFHFRN